MTYKTSITTDFTILDWFSEHTGVIFRATSYVLLWLDFVQSALSITNQVQIAVTP